MHPDSDQLSMWEDEGGLCLPEVRIPWSGRSPRALTRGRLGFILTAQARKSVSDAGRPLGVTDEKGGFIYEGAPLLLPLLGGVADGTR